MLDEFLKLNRSKETIFLGTLSAMCFAISIFRFILTESGLFLFLNWNLFLAFIPWMLSSLMMMKVKFSGNKFLIFILLISWILFFPNAPYILTDLFHLRMKTSMPMWFDLVLILFFAWTGLLFGFTSLRDIEEILSSFVTRKAVPVIISMLLFFGSFGIYVGRYLRWNSWDVVSDPSGLFYDISDRFINPTDHPGTWGVTIFMGIFLNVIYWSLRFFSGRFHRLA